MKVCYSSLYQLSVISAETILAGLSSVTVYINVLFDMHCWEKVLRNNSAVYEGDIGLMV